MVTVVIAEKPSVARDIARVLGAKGRKDGYLEGAGYRVGWCVGHVLELVEPAAYDPNWKTWSTRTLPMLPERFKLKARKGASKPLAVVKRLLKGSDVTEVINACDAGREGELIFRWVWDHTFGHRSGPPVRRLWIASLTDRAISDGFASLRPSSATDGLADAARCRSEADWMVGLNATRAMTLLARRSGSKGRQLFPVGRVQTPTLAMLCDRESAIEAFKADAFWTVEATFDPQDGRATWTGRWQRGKSAVKSGRFEKADLKASKSGHAERLDRVEDAEAIVSAVQGARAQVTRVTRAEVRERAPALFDLTTLQKVANRRFGLSAARTLRAAQTLYERHKALTYPRTDARFVTSDMRGILPGLLRDQVQTPWGSAAQRAVGLGSKPTRRVVNDAEVGDHHALLPTHRIPKLGVLGADERRVYELVARRFVAVFLPDARFDKRVIEADAAGHRFVASGRTRTELGWHEVEPPARRSGDAPLLPDMREGENAAVADVDAKRGDTQPPKRHTEATLLSAMENPKANPDDAPKGQRKQGDGGVGDAELRRALKEAGLGTPATRANIIETLIHRELVYRDKKALVPAPRGRALVASLPVPELRSAALTGAWEARLTRMAEGRGETAAGFMADIRVATTDFVRRMREADPPAAFAEAAKQSIPYGDTEELGRCPVCQTAVTEGRKAYSCATGRDCAFVIFKSIAGKKVSPTLVKVLLNTRRSKLLPGFKSKAGKRFKAALVLGDDGRISLDFNARPGASTAGSRSKSAAPAPQRTPSPAPANVKAKAAPRKNANAPRCPKCRLGEIIRGRAAWGCSRWRHGCGFTVAFVQQGHVVPDDEADRLFRRKQTRLMEGLMEGRKARLVLDLDAEGNTRVEPGKR